MSKLKECPACNKEVSKSAKSCPHCGKKLKMGLFLKLLIGIAILIGIGVAVSPSPEEKAKAQSEMLQELQSTAPSSLSPFGELSEIYSLGSKHTDIQRDNKEKEITGEVVQWTLEVYEVNKMDENKYKVQTKSGMSSVGAFVVLYARSPEEAARIEALTTGSKVTFKGKIEGTFMRNIEIEPAILAN